MQKPNFNEILQQKILIMDGAMGTMLQKAELTAADFGGEQYEGCNEMLNLTIPETIESIHEAYLKAGADIIETNTFGATQIVLDEYHLGHKSYEINKAAAIIANRAADNYTTIEKPRFVAGSMGPTTKTLSVTGGTTFEELSDHYEVQARALIDGGVDLLLIETSQDLLNVKAAFVGIKKAYAFTGLNKPLIISGTIEPMGTTLAGQGIEAFYISVEHMNPVAVGLNCATGPEFMQEHIRSLSELAATAISCYPNAGLPDEEGCYHETPESLSIKLSGFAKQGWINIVGGCCGTTPEHIAAIADALKDISPRKVTAKLNHQLSGIEPLIYDPSIRPIMVGERTNVIGSRKFKRLIGEAKFEEAAEIARAQVKRGANVIDICLADPDRDEITDMENFLSEVTKKIKVPLVIDSTDEVVIAKALTYSQGKAIINSINLEDGEERFAIVSKLIHEYGGAVVVGTIDEIGMAVTAKRKLEIAQRSYQLLVHKYGIQPQDIIFDPLVFPVGTGDEQYIGSAKETIEAIQLIKEHIPLVKTILGISNVSFGLPPVGREILNSVYLYHCTKAGLDYAIVNTEKLERFPSISTNEVHLAEKLLFHTTDAILADFTEFYRDKKKEVKVPISTLSLEERLSSYIIEGTKEGLIPDLECARKKYDKPLDIINGPLMDGMAEVGRLFNDNQLIVAEVLQSAEAMKAAVAHLEPYMEKGSAEMTKGKVLLATVKGDVHDIGKNLVDIILSNNGFQTVDLGIKVSSADLIQAIQNEKPDIVGLSGLLVKSAQQMALTAKDMKDANISIPILVGGAALSRKFTNTKIAQNYDGLVLYAKDAMTGLSLANELKSPERYDLLVAEQQERRQLLIQRQDEGSVVVKTKAYQQVKTIRKAKVFVPKDLTKHVITNLSFSHIQPYINKTMLMHHLGVKGKKEGIDEKRLKVEHLIDDLIEQSIINNWITPAAVYQFFPAKADGDFVSILHPQDYNNIIEKFQFPRQQNGQSLCLADYLHEDTIDYVGFFAVTAGKGIRKAASLLKEKGRFLESHALQALALETAEGLAEYIHRQMRDRWGFPDAATMTMAERFAAKYQGQRFSFGYPACPNLEDQAKLFHLITPEDIGIQLTEGFMMEPEASVTAMVFAHPDARYFNVL
ncbi:methionine synthase [Cytobacillus horneckiae]|uniref:methionine synthase n=1 Tax=Cytobacillus horneckiae TaxID=549687 RepID=UPI003D9A64AF